MCWLGEIAVSHGWKLVFCGDPLRVDVLLWGFVPSRQAAATQCDDLSQQNGEDITDTKHLSDVSLWISSGYIIVTLGLWKNVIPSTEFYDSVSPPTTNLRSVYFNASWSKTKFHCTVKHCTFFIRYRSVQSNLEHSIMKFNTSLYNSTIKFHLTHSIFKLFILNVNMPIRFWTLLVSFEILHSGVKLELEC